MFKIVSIAGFLITFVGIGLHFLFSYPKFDDIFGKERKLRKLDWLRVPIFIFTMLLPEQKQNIFGKLRKLCFILAVLCFVVLLVTGFYQLLILGKHLSGYLLMIHATFAPIFAVCLAAMACFWAQNCRFDQDDWGWLASLGGCKSSDKSSCWKSYTGQKICFWLIIILALPLILSVVSSMFPLFGTYGQELLLNTHRYTALLIVLTAIVHSYLLIRIKIDEQQLSA